MQGEEPAQILSPVIAPEEVANAGQITSGDDLSMDPGMPNDGMPPPEAFFVPGEDVRGVLVAFKEDETKTGKYMARLTFECADGPIEVTGWDNPVTKYGLSWSECLDKNVWFKVREGKPFRGKPQYSLQALELYNE
jgi:hypothetical protein